MFITQNANASNKTHAILMLYSSKYQSVRYHPQVKTKYNKIFKEQLLNLAYFLNPDKKIKNLFYKVF